MKGLKISLLVVVMALMIMGVAGTTYAFHDGGVAKCEGCHTMHESLNGSVMMISKFGTKVIPSGASLMNGPTVGGQWLLLGGDQSSTCLNCHASADATVAAAQGSYHVMSSFSGNNAIPVERGPGGDFAWLTISGLNGTKATNPGNHHGHNIVATDFGLTSSTNYAANGGFGPGGVYPVGNLACTSCHNPHSDYRINSTGTMVKRAVGTKVDPISASGSYGGTIKAGEAVGVYRFLGGTGYLPKSMSGNAGAAFGNAPPVAVAPGTYNMTEAGATNAANSVVRVAYGSGMSEWCANCHSGLLNSVADPSATHRHPAGAAALLNNATGAEAINYNAYLASGDLTGNSSSSYNSLVPYEEGLALNTANYATLTSHATSSTVGAYLTGPTSGTENVACISCHRAHASAFPEMTRWDAQGGQYLTMDGVYIGTDNYTTISDSSTAQRISGGLGYTTAQLSAAYYDRAPGVFSTFQRSLCNKCHAKD